MFRSVTLLVAPAVVMRTVFFHAQHSEEHRPIGEAVERANTKSIKPTRRTRHTAAGYSHIKPEEMKMTVNDRDCHICVSLLEVTDR